MITIRFNDEWIKILNHQSLMELLTEKGYINHCFAIVLNAQFIPRLRYSEVFLKENDAVEIIMPMQGG